MQEGGQGNPASDYASVAGAAAVEGMDGEAEFGAKAPGNPENGTRRNLAERLGLNVRLQNNGFGFQRFQ